MPAKSLSRSQWQRVNASLATPAKSSSPRITSYTRRFALGIFRPIDVDKASFGQRFAHFVHVEAERSSLKLLALSVLVVFALLRLLRRFDGQFFRDNDNAIVVGDHDITWFNINSGTHDRDVDRAEGGFHRALGGDRLRPNRKAHFR